jgi:kynureninase
MAPSTSPRAAAAACDDPHPLAGFRARSTGTGDDGPDRLLAAALDEQGAYRSPARWPTWRR